ncbi:unnamed protein product [Citrullus colocynthis]|uniref:Uncharacterized protein n=1 Tax=Citrullus colocynthis TaxID=252529 RepID=A0ABP0Z0L8_9ROSI
MTINLAAVASPAVINSPAHCRPFYCSQNRRLFGLDYFSQAFRLHFLDLAFDSFSLEKVVVEDCKASTHYCICEVKNNASQLSFFLNPISRSATPFLLISAPPFAARRLRSCRSPRLPTESQPLPPSLTLSTPSNQSYLRFIFVTNTVVQP